MRFSKEGVMLPPGRYKPQAMAATSSFVTLHVIYQSAVVTTAFDLHQWSELLLHNGFQRQYVWNSGDPVGRLWGPHDRF